MVMNEELSRLMDGDLPDAEADRVVGECRRPEALQAWSCYHLIGDVLRGSQPTAWSIVPRVCDALRSEPTVLAPPRARSAALASWAWAAAATLAAVTVVGWTAFSLTQAPGTAIAKVREAGAVSAAQVRPQTVPQDYVLVHQEYSPATAIQGVRPYVHAVSAPVIDR
jgi:sigma-E factor negative regulatory protein RseA